jgi:hypothetical protein
MLYIPLLSHLHLVLRTRRTLSNRRINRRPPLCLQIPNRIRLHKSSQERHSNQEDVKAPHSRTDRHDARQYRLRRGGLSKQVSRWGTEPSYLILCGFRVRLPCPTAARRDPRPLSTDSVCNDRGCVDEVVMNGCRDLVARTNQYGVKQSADASNLGESGSCGGRFVGERTAAARKSRPCSPVIE